MPSRRLGLCAAGSQCASRTVRLVDDYGSGLRAGRGLLLVRAEGLYRGFRRSSLLCSAHHRRGSYFVRSRYPPTCKAF
jgi:hypothetical protein